MIDGEKGREGNNGSGRNYSRADTDTKRRRKQGEMKAVFNQGGYKEVEAGNRDSRERTTHTAAGQL